MDIFAFTYRVLLFWPFKMWGFCREDVSHRATVKTYNTFNNNIFFCNALYISNMCWNREEGMCRALWRETFLEVGGGGITMDTLVGEEGKLILNPLWDREPMERFKDGSDMIIFAHPHQDPSSTVLNVLQLLEAFATDPNEERITIVQPGGDKGVDKLFCIYKSMHRVKFGDVPQVEKRGLTQMFDVILKRQLQVHFHTQVGDSCWK